MRRTRLLPAVAGRLPLLSLAAVLATALFFGPGAGTGLAAEALSPLSPGPVPVDRLRPLQGLFVLLDPGHGGADPGAVGPTGLTEAETNLRVARYLGQLLRADGARVAFTREGDQTLSLGERVALSDRLRPDLFVSIHHNASLAPRSQSRAEVFFNAQDRGMPLAVAAALREEFGLQPGSAESLLLPGGFFVLRQNPVPALLTEASYISIPLQEKALKTGRALTDEAQAIRRAIQKAFRHPPLRVRVVGDQPEIAHMSWATLLLAASDEIAGVALDMTGPARCAWQLTPLPSPGHLYALRNREPLPSGEYKLRLMLRGRQGNYSPWLEATLQVELPVDRCEIVPLARDLPIGTRGVLPCTLRLFDDQGQLNRRAVPYRLDAGGRRFLGTTDAGGETVVEIPLDEPQTNDIELVLQIEQGPWARARVPVVSPRHNYAIGRVESSHSGEGLADTTLAWGPGRETRSDARGWYCVRWPLAQGNLRLRLTPPAGYGPEERWLKAVPGTVTRPRFVLSPLLPGLVGKRFALMGPDALRDLTGELHRTLVQAGATSSLLPLQRDEESAWRAVALANRLQPPIDVLLSIRLDPARPFSLLHYHRSGGGSQLAARLAGWWQTLGGQPAWVVGPGSTYEIGHTAATALVVSLPTLPNPGTRGLLTAALLQALAGRQPPATR